MRQRGKWPKGPSPIGLMGPLMGGWGPDEVVVRRMRPFPLERLGVVDLYEIRERWALPDLAHCTRV